MPFNSRNAAVEISRVEKVFCVPFAISFYLPVMILSGIMTVILKRNTSIKGTRYVPFVEKNKGELNEKRNPTVAFSVIAF